MVTINEETQNNVGRQAEEEHNESDLVDAYCRLGAWCGGCLPLFTLFLQPHGAGRVASASSFAPLSSSERSYSFRGHFRFDSGSVMEPWRSRFHLCALPLRSDLLLL